MFHPPTHSPDSSALETHEKKHKKQKRHEDEKERKKRKKEKKRKKQRHSPEPGSGGLPMQSSQAPIWGDLSNYHHSSPLERS